MAPRSPRDLQTWTGYSYLRRLVCEQWLPRRRDDIFPFFADAANLKEITPALLRFQFLTPLPVSMAVGTQIEYRIRINGVPVRWLTEIAGWNPPQEFIDVQLRGPYRLWHHRHEFIEERGGTLIRDTVHYVVPCGVFGHLLHGLYVKPSLRKIFLYRYRTVAERLGTGPAEPPETCLSFS